MQTDQLLQRKNNEGMIGIPVHFRPRVRVHQVFDGQPVEVVLVSQQFDDIPGEAITIVQVSRILSTL